MLLSSRPLAAEPTPVPAPPGQVPLLPTHLLHGAYAHPITSSPLFIGLDEREAKTALSISGSPAEWVRRCCLIQRTGSEVVLINEWPAGTTVDDRVILESVVLKPGQTFRAGAHPDELKLIACMGDDEKEKHNHL